MNQMLLIILIREKTNKTLEKDFKDNFGFLTLSNLKLLLI